MEQMAVFLCPPTTESLSYRYYNDIQPSVKTDSPDCKAVARSRVLEFQSRGGNDHRTEAAVMKTAQWGPAQCWGRTFRHRNNQWRQMRYRLFYGIL